jgi:O-antigen/teichoic acid export membrane protein
MNNSTLARGTLTAGVASAVKLCVQVVTLPLMARLVGPADYGLFGLAMPTVMFVLILADSGFGISLAREPESNIDIWSTATWFLFALGVGLAAAVILWSFIQAPLVKQPQLPLIMSALAICPVLLALTVPANARLLRQGRIGLSSLMDLAANLVGAGTAVTLAMLGAGVWSLVAQPVVYWLVKVVSSNTAAPFVPRARFVTKHIHSHLKIGGFILSGKLLETAGRTIEASLISRFLGAAFLGAYSFAGQLPRFLTEAVGNSLWSMLYAYALRTEDQANVLRVYRLALRFFALIVFPGVALVSVLATPIIDILLGPRWSSAITILQILLVSQAFNALAGIGTAVLYARGGARLIFRIGIEAICLRIAVVAAVPWIGFTWMAVGLGMTDLFLTYRGIFAATHALGTRPRTIFSAIAVPVVASALSGLLCWVLARGKFNPFEMPIFGATMIHMLAGAILYVLVILLLDRRGIFEDGKVVFNLLRK